MGLFSSKSSSSQTTQNFDQRVVADAGGIGISGSSNVNVLDGGAIDSAFAFANSNVETQAASFHELIDLAGKQLKSGTETLSQAGTLVAKAYDDAKGEGATKLYMVAALVAVIAVVALRALR